MKLEGAIEELCHTLIPSCVPGLGHRQAVLYFRQYETEKCSPPFGQNHPLLADVALQSKIVCSTQSIGKK